MIRRLLLVNLITFIRIIGIFIVLMCYDKSGITLGLLVITLYLTDILDGVLARLFKVSTFFGALLDGVADKLFTIVNFILLCLIAGKYAIICVILELLILLVQLIKYNLNYNIKSNIIGKIKVWILAVSIVATYILSDYNNLNIYLYTLMPSIIAELITLISYIYETIVYKKDVNEHKKVKRIKLNSSQRKNYLKEVWFSPKFYEEHKLEANLRDLRIEAKRNMK